MSAPEWKYLVVGCFGSTLYGLYPALYGIAIGGIYEVSKIVNYILTSGFGHVPQGSKYPNMSLIGLFY